MELDQDEPGHFTPLSPPPAASSTPLSPLVYFEPALFVDQHIPGSNLEALYVHQTPTFESSSVGPSSQMSSSSRSRSAPRVSLAPNTPSGNSTSSTDKTVLLISIISSDPVLREQGIRLTFERRLHSALDANLRDKIRQHSNAAFMTQVVVWIGSRSREHGAQYLDR